MLSGAPLSGGPTSSTPPRTSQVVVVPHVGGSTGLRARGVLYDVNQYQQVGPTIQLTGAEIQATHPIPPVEQPPDQWYGFASPVFNDFRRRLTVVPRFEGVLVAPAPTYIFPVSQPDYNQYREFSPQFRQDVRPRFEGNTDTNPIPSVDQIAWTPYVIHWGLSDYTSVVPGGASAAKDTPDLKAVNSQPDYRYFTDLGRRRYDVQVLPPLVSGDNPESIAFVAQPDLRQFAVRRTYDTRLLPPTIIVDSQEFKTTGLQIEYRYYANINRRRYSVPAAWPVEGATIQYLTIVSMDSVSFNFTQFVNDSWSGSD